MKRQLDSRTVTPAHNSKPAGSGLGESTIDGLNQAVGQLFDNTPAEHWFNVYKDCGYG